MQRPYPTQSYIAFFLRNGITHPNYPVYLAVDNKIYEKFFAQIAIQLIIQKYQVLLLAIDIKKEEIIKWIS